MTRFGAFSIGCALALSTACGGTSKSPGGEASGGWPAGAGGSTNAGGTKNGGNVAVDSSGTSGSESVAGESGSGGTAGTNEGGVSSGGMGDEAGAGGRGDAGSGGSAGEPKGAVAEPESPCNEPGERACAGNHQRVTLVCSGGAWQVSDVCGENQVCDTAPGLNQGACSAMLPECAAHEPGYAFCSGPTTLNRCGPDSLTLLSEECTGSCHGDACDNRPNYCPAETFVNCGEECRERDESCFTSGGCEGAVHSTAASPGPGEIQMVRVGFETSCPVQYSSECGSYTRRVLVNVSTPGSGSDWIRVTAPEGWKVSDLASCPEAVSCLILDIDTSFVVYLLTKDSTAPEQNIVIERAASGETLECP
jgi:hypothetical protein